MTMQIVKKNMSENATIHSFGNIFEIGNDVPTSLDVTGFLSESSLGSHSSNRCLQGLCNS